MLNNKVFMSSIASTSPVTSFENYLLKKKLILKIEKVFVCKINKLDKWKIFKKGKTYGFIILVVEVSLTD